MESGEDRTVVDGSGTAVHAAVGTAKERRAAAVKVVFIMKEAVCFYDYRQTMKLRYVPC